MGLVQAHLKMSKFTSDSVKCLFFSHLVVSKHKIYMYKHVHSFSVSKKKIVFKVACLVVKKTERKKKVFVERENYQK